MPHQDNSSPLLLETIKIEEGKIHNLSYHQARCNRSRQTLFHTTDTLDLSSIIKPPHSGLYRCRILYHEKLHSIEYIPYIPKRIERLRIVSSNITYDFKYADRDELNNLLASNQDVDEVIIEKDGVLTDTTISNIAFFDGEKWFTPHQPLLEGTMRAKLIHEGVLQPKEIRKEMLANYSQVALINAMIGFKTLNIDAIQNITKGKS